MAVHLDPGALARILASAEAKAAAGRVAEGVAEEVRSQGITVGDVQADGIGREIALPVLVHEDHVILAHPAGVAVQAKDGALTRAASARGLAVKGG